MSLGDDKPALAGASGTSSNGDVGIEMNHAAPSMLSHSRGEQTNIGINNAPDSSDDEDSGASTPHCHDDIVEMEESNTSRRKLIFAAVLCLSFMMAEIVGGILSNSLAIMTDAMHLLTDLVGFGIGVAAITLAKRPATQNLTFGWYRAEVLGALISVLLVWAITAVLFFMAIQRIVSNTYEIDAPIMLITSSLGVGINLLMGIQLQHGGHGHSHGIGHSHTHAITRRKSTSAGRLSVSSHHSHSHHEHEDHGHGHGHSHDGHGHSHEGHGHSHDGHGHSHHHHEEEESRGRSTSYGSMEGTPPGANNLQANQPPVAEQLVARRRSSDSKQVVACEVATAIGTPGLASSEALVGSMGQPITQPRPGAEADSLIVQSAVAQAAPEIVGKLKTFSFSARPKSETSDIEEGHGHSHSHHHHDHDHDHEMVVDEDSDEEGEHEQETDMNVRAAVIHILGDLGQSIGVMIAALVIYFEPDFKMADPICTFIFSVIVLFTTITIIRDVFHILMEGTPRNVDYEQMKMDLMKIRGVKSVHNLRIWALTVSKVAASAHIAFSVRRGDKTTYDDVLQRCRRLLHRRYGIADLTLQVEHHTLSMDNCGKCQLPAGRKK